MDNRDGEWLALAVFSASAQKRCPSDAWIGGTNRIRYGQIRMGSSSSRYLIPPGAASLQSRVASTG